MLDHAAAACQLPGPLSAAVLRPLPRSPAADGGQPTLLSLHTASTLLQLHSDEDLVITNIQVRSWLYLISIHCLILTCNRHWTVRINRIIPVTNTIEQ